MNRIMSVLLVTLLALSVGIQFASARTIRLAHVWAPNSGADKAIEDFIEYVHKQSSGRLKIENFPGGVLGDSPELLEMLQENAIQIQATNVARMADISSVKEMAVFDAPFVFEGNKHMTEFSLSDVVQSWAKRVLDETGLRWLCTHGMFGGRHLSNSVRPVRTPSDLKGLRIRVHDAPTRVAMIRSWGAEPIVTPTSEMYTAMQTGLCQGQESPLWWQVDYSYWEVQKYVSLTGHLYQNAGIVVNGDFWRSLSEEDQAILKAGAVRWATLYTSLLEADDAKALETLRAHGMEIIEDVDIEAFRQATASMWNEYENLWGPGIISDIINGNYRVLTPEEWQNF